MSQKLILDQLGGGVLTEKISREFQNVLHNMTDVNTGVKDKRVITATLTFTQNEARDDVKVDISVKSKLAPVVPGKTQFFIGKDLDTGVIAFEEYGNRSMIKGQMSLDLDKGEESIPVDQIPIEPKKFSDYKKTMTK